MVESCTARKIQAQATPVPEKRTESSSQDASTGIEIVAGTVSGAIQTVIGHPLDTVKVHIQTGRAPDMSRAIRAIFAEGGYGKCFFRGLTGPMLAQPPISGLAFGGYSLGEQGLDRGLLLQDEPIQKAFVAGAVGGLTQSVAMAAGDYQKVVFQTRSDMTLSRFASLLLREGGVRGLGATLLRDLPGYGIYFGVYEWAKQALTSKGQEPGVREIAAAGALSGIASWGLMIGADTIKTRVQESSRPTTVKNVISDIWKKSGLRGFTTGLIPTVIRAALVTAPGFLGYEKSKEWLTS